ncbi:MAG TPA: serine protein kinase RIO [Candidatus Poseidoniales archaeon]|nr:serine protein kinase RIO [Candidatus Poseidoniales archaeon]
MTDEGNDGSGNGAIDDDDTIEFTGAATELEWMDLPRNEQIFRDIEEQINTGHAQVPDRSGRKVLDSVFDHSTLMAIYKLMQDGIIEQLDHPIARGKEAHVYHATGPKGPIAVKIFHTTNAVFKNLLKYIEGDPRFTGLKRKHRDLVTIWVRKEMRNLIRMHREGVRVPEPIRTYQNVLVMTFLGEEGRAAPQIRQVELDDPEAVVIDLANMLRLIWQQSELAHADFSEYNILWHQDEPWIIDVGQAVSARHPRAEEYLVRDIEKLHTWSNRQGVMIPLEDLALHVIDDEGMGWNE